MELRLHAIRWQEYRVGDILLLMRSSSECPAFSLSSADDVAVLSARDRCLLAGLRLA